MPVGDITWDEAPVQPQGITWDATPAATQAVPQGIKWDQPATPQSEPISKTPPAPQAITWDAPTRTLQPVTGGPANLNTHQRDFTGVPEGEAVVDDDWKKKAAQIQADAYTLIHNGLSNQETLDTLQKVHGTFRPQDIPVLNSYFDEYRKGGNRPINFGQEEHTQPTVTANVPKESAPQAVGHSIYDTITGLVRGATEEPKNWIDSWGDRALNAFGLESDTELAKNEEDRAAHEASEYYNPQGWSRTVGSFVGNAVPIVGVEALTGGEATPGLLEGAASKYMTTVGKGALWGAVMSGGKDVGINALNGALLAGALHGGIGSLPAALGLAGSGIDHVAGALGIPVNALADRMAGVISRASDLKDVLFPTDNPKVTAQTFDPEMAKLGVTAGATDSAAAVRANHLEMVKAAIDDTTKNWEESPNVNILGSVRNITKAQRAEIIAEGGDPKNLNGWVSKDGTVNIVADKHATPEEVQATLFHEQLGHVGLTRTFGSGLDALLQHVYDTNWKARMYADRYNEKFPDVYKGQDQHLRATEEYLAALSEKGPQDLSAWEQTKQFIKNFAREKLGWNLRTSDTDVKQILSETHTNAMAKAPDASKQAGTRLSQVWSGETPPQGSRFSIRGNDILSEDDFKAKSRWTRNVVDAVKSEIGSKMSFDDAIDRVSEVGLTPSKMMKKALSHDPTLALNARQAMYDMGEKLRSLSTKIDNGTATVAETDKFKKNFSQYVRYIENVEGYVSNIARSMSFLRMTKGEFDKMPEGVDLAKLDDPNYLREVAFKMRTYNDPAQQAKLAKDIAKGLPEDALTSIHYDLMLSGVRTQTRNVFGQMTNLAMDMLVAKPAGKALGEVGNFLRKLTGTTSMTPSETMSMREYGARWVGLIRSLTDTATWKQTAQSFAEMRPISKGDLQFETKGSPIPGVDYGRRGLAAADNLIHSIITNSDFYGAAVREAQHLGLKGPKFWDHVDYLVNNPTEKMVKEGNEYASDIGLIGKADGPLSRAIQAFNSYAVKHSDTLEGKTILRPLRFIIQNAVPFQRVASNMVRMSLEWSPATALSRNTRAAFGLEGSSVARQTAIAKAVIGAALGWHFGQMYVDGNLRKNPTTGYIEYKSGKFWHSMNGMDALIGIVGPAMGMIDAYKSAKGHDLVQATADVINGFGAAFYSEGFGEQLGTLLDAMNPKGEHSLHKLIDTQATSWEPALAKDVTKAYTDPMVRDTSAKVLNPETKRPEEDWGQQTLNKLQANIPGESNKLPLKLDNLGRPTERYQNITGLFDKTPIDTDPVANEIDRLHKALGKPVLGNPTQLNNQGQLMAGTQIHQTVQSLLDSPGWGQIPDAAKASVIKRLATTSRKQAKSFTTTPTPPSNPFVAPPAPQDITWDQ